MPPQHWFVGNDPDAVAIRHIEQAACIVAHHTRNAIEGLKHTGMNRIAYIQQSNRLWSIARAETVVLNFHRVGWVRVG